MSNFARIADSPYAGGVLHKLEETTERLARIKYKRGYTFSAEIRYDQVFVIFKAKVEDSRRPQPEVRYEIARFGEETPYPLSPLPNAQPKMVDIQMPVSLPYYVHESPEERMFFTWFRDMLQLFERHESLEWYRVDGELYEDPHAPKK